jgi:hypothetical protein
VLKSILLAPITYELRMNYACDPYFRRISSVIPGGGLLKSLYGRGTIILSLFTAPIGTAFACYLA